MTNHMVENKVRQEVFRLKKDLNTLKEEGVSQIERLEKQVVQAADDITTLVEDNAAQLSHGIENLSDKVRQNADETAMMLKKNVRRGLRQYNANAQDLVSKMPGSLDKQVNKYPWVALSLVFVLGILMGVMVKSSHTGR